MTDDRRPALGLRTPSRTPPVAPPGKPLAIVIDPEPILCRLFAHAVARCGFQVLAAGNAEEALAILGAPAAGRDAPPRPAVLVTNVGHRHGGGARFAAAAAARWPGLTVVLTAGYALDDDAQRLLAGVAHAFLLKPFGIDALRRAIAGPRAAAGPD